MKVRGGGGSVKVRVRAAIVLWHDHPNSNTNPRPTLCETFLLTGSGRLHEGRSAVGMKGVHISTLRDEEINNHVVTTRRRIPNGMCSMDLM